MLALSARPALVLNADYQPLNYFPLSVMGWKDSVRNVYEGNVAVVAEYDIPIRSPSVEMKLPSVVALRQYVPVPERVAFTRFNVFLRDRFRCQYCGDKHGAGDLTFDHVVPRSRGGGTNWKNVVTACDRCNGVKGNRTDMVPMKVPREPAVRELLAVKRLFPPQYLHESWADFLYWDTELEG